MRLLFVIPEYPPHSGGGIITFYGNLIPALAQRGHSIHVIVGSAFTSKLPGYETDGVTVEFLDHNVVDENLNKFSRYDALPELQRHLAAAWTAWEQANKGEGFDLVETTDWGLLFVPWIVKADSPPNVVQLHGSIGQIDFYDPRRGEELHGCVTRLMESQLLSCADELQSYSKSNANSWQSLSGRQVTYMPPAWEPTTTAAEHSDQSSRGLVVGRIQHWKGPTVLCEAMRLLGDAAPELDWAGRDTTFQDAGTSMSAFLAQNYPDVWGKSIRPLGPLSPQEVSRLQSSAAFVVVPSLWDVFNYTCVEAMGYGRLVLCSAGAGAAGLITNGEDGFIFPANDSVSLADILKRVGQMDEASRKELGQRAKRTIATTLAVSRIAEQKSQAYAKAIERGKYPTRPNAWLEDATSPCQVSSEKLSFLDRLPLREISSYALGRGVKKLLSSTK
jgi:glycosyltransferase involved in cell wall biosynthesis